MNNRIEFETPNGTKTSRAAQLKWNHKIVVQFYRDSYEKSAKFYGPRAGAKQKQPPAWSSGIIPPPLLVSIASNILTTSSMSGRFSGFASQHLFMMFARELGQHLGISGLRFWICHNIKVRVTLCWSQQNMKEENDWDERLKHLSPQTPNISWIFIHVQASGDMKHTVKLQ